MQQYEDIYNDDRANICYVDVHESLTVFNDIHAHVDNRARGSSLYIRRLYKRASDVDGGAAGLKAGQISPSPQNENQVSKKYACGSGLAVNYQKSPSQNWMTKTVNKTGSSSTAKEVKWDLTALTKSWANAHP